jgi:hypothetical protein
MITVRTISQPKQPLAEKDLRRIIANTNAHKQAVIAQPAQYGYVGELEEVEIPKFRKKLCDDALIKCQQELNKKTK